MKKTSRTVSFQMDDTSERVMLEYLEKNKIRFSPFVKRLIWTYMQEQKSQEKLPKVGQM